MRPMSALRVEPGLLSQLLEEGYLIIRGVISPDLAGEVNRELDPRFVRTPFGRGAFYGDRTKRFGRILMRTRHADAIVRDPAILSLVEQVLLPWCDCIQLNTTQAIGIHPGALAQMPHRDHDMWGMPPGEAEFLVNVMWPLTEFTALNGATRVWAGTKAIGSDDGAMLNLPLVAEMQPGDALLILGSTLHAAGANRSERERRGLVIGYSLGWLRPYENPQLAYPPVIARRFSPELAALAGYRIHRPNLGNFEGCCPSRLLRDGRKSRFGAEDALKPEQRAAVEAHALAQRLPE